MDTPTTVPSLRLVSEQVLRLHWPSVRDIGDCPYDLVQNLLKLSTAGQLAEIEDAAPHIAPNTNHLWRQLCINDFIEVRKLVEDRKLNEAEIEGSSWKDKYYDEDEKKQIKMKLVLEKLRGQYNEIDEKKQSRQVQSIDGLRLEKRRKLSSQGSSSARPKSLLDKARSSTKAIRAVYAPKRKPIPAPSARKVPALASAFPSARKPPPAPFSKVLDTAANFAARSNPPDSSALDSAVDPSLHKRPAIKTVTRTTTKRSSTLLSPSPPPAERSQTSKLNCTSPPSGLQASPARLVAQLPRRAGAPTVPPGRRPLPPPPPPPLPPPAAPATPVPTNDCPGALSAPPVSPFKSQLPLRKPKPAAGLFIPKKR
ncbi:uncharacterized protein JCM15063_002309 [Sporobolomyces koalae]|uniref:uncharacterized protein n=1 Tax=Sporobolomyces koalae TaxID=500713 RepID=UPI00317A90D5